MSKFHKRNKSKKRTRRKQKTVEDAKNKIGEIILSSKDFEEDIEVLETPFGEISIHDGMLAHSFKNKGMLFEILTIDDEIKEGDTISRLIYFEKLKDKYPNEPFIAFEITECYRKLKEQEKCDQLVKENYEKHRGYPFIDISYVVLNLDGYDDDVSDVVFGKELNIHQVYPKFKAFDSQVVAEFYFVLSQIYKDRNELVIARNCAEIVKQINSTKGLILETSINFIEKPWLKWRANFFMIFIVLVLLGIVGGIIWGIISLFQWIF